MQSTIHLTFRKYILVHTPVQKKSDKIPAPLKMLIEAALNNQLMGIPFINNPNFIRKYLAPLPSTPKGRMKKPKGAYAAPGRNSKADEQPS